MTKSRVDILLVERGLADSRNQAQRLVMAGQVRAGDQVVTKPSTLLPRDTSLAVVLGPRFVSRGGEKLLAALQAFEVDPEDKTCADVGASTGGFTDCLLQHGATKVYAIDVGQGILHWKLRQDPRVVVMEDCNARYLEHLPEPVELVTIDASFISLKVLLPVVREWFQPTPGSVGEATVIALIKPQFEAGRAEAAHGEGVIRDPAVHRQVLEQVLAFAQSEGYTVRGLLRSPLRGPKGNVEFLAWMDLTAEATRDLKEMIERALL
jgi:23S rRNA (cytidine1920-2'-O)/16S rRNA (cytidine1409-2'-O)-methyltransferase